jgi:predicted Fe-Mo cluster-binding NifX family protein
MKIAIVTDDGTTISQHFGRAEQYEVLTVENGQVTSRETRPKPAHGLHHHEQPSGTVRLDEGVQGAARIEAGNTHGVMIDPIRDCQVLISRGMGQRAYDSLREAGIEPVVTVVREIDEAVKKYLSGELVNHTERLHQKWHAASEEVQLRTIAGRY